MTPARYCLKMILVGAGLAACGPADTGRVAADRVVEGAADPGAAWPLLLAHCLRQLACDPTSDFGKGAGEASGVSGSVAWFARTADRSVILSVYGERGVGGEGGRPLTINELPDSLGGAVAKRSVVAVSYRLNGGDPVLQEVRFRSAWLELQQPGSDGFRLEIKSTDGQVVAMSAHAAPVTGKAGIPGLRPVTFDASVGASDAGALVQRLQAGQSFSLSVLDPKKRTALADVLYTVGYSEALKQATFALQDPEAALPIAARCQRFRHEPDAFWKTDAVSAAQLVCDPRTPEQRR